MKNPLFPVVVFLAIIIAGLLALDRIKNARVNQSLRNAAEAMDKQQLLLERQQRLIRFQAEVIKAHENQGVKGT